VKLLNVTVAGENQVLCSAIMGGPKACYARGGPGGADREGVDEASAEVAAARHVHVDERSIGAAGRTSAGERSVSITTRITAHRAYKRARRGDSLASRCHA
jgi:hypothetical protein